MRYAASLFAALLIIAPAAWAQQAEPEPNATVLEVVAEEAYVYEEPNTQSAQRFQLRRGNALVAYDEEGDFFAVGRQDMGLIGYALKSKVRRTGERVYFAAAEPELSRADVRRGMTEYQRRSLELQREIAQDTQTLKAIAIGGVVVGVAGFLAGVVLASG